MKRENENTLYYDKYGFDLCLPFEKLIVFDSGCPGWTNSPEKNLRYLVSMQRRYNDLFKENQYIFLADIYAELGYDESLAESWGWSYDPEKPWGNNYIDFGIYDIYQKKNREFVNGKNPDVILKFNADCDLTEYVIDNYIRRNGEWCDYIMPLHIGEGVHC